MKTTSVIRSTILATCVAGLLAAPAAQAAPHGCVSATSNVWLSPDVARRSFAMAVNTNTPCQFYFSPGDTFTGSGEYKISCETGGEVTDSLGQGMQSQVPIPQPCAPGAVVTIYGGHLGNGGAVVAGSPT